MGEQHIHNEKPVQGQNIAVNQQITQNFYGNSTPSEHKAPSSPAKPQRVWNIPYLRNDYFTGRTEILEQLHVRFQTGQATALSQRTAMCGLGGIGKTQIAVEYAYEHCDDYQSVLWARAESHEALTSSFVEIARLLDLPQKDEQDQTITVQAVKRWLQDNNGWLLILDNADEPKIVREFLPTKFDGHILLTTRAQALGGLAQGIDVDIFTPELGALFLLRRATLIEANGVIDDAVAQDRAVAMQISEELGGLPLALDQAGAYIEETSCSLTDYLGLYCTRRAEVLNERGGLTGDHPDSVATTWSLSFQRVEEKNAAAADLMRLCAFLAPDAIPEEIITAGAEHLGPVLQGTAHDPMALNKAIATLGAYSLIKRDAIKKMLNIHRLVQAVLKDAMDAEIVHQWAKYAILAVNQIFPNGEFDTWPRCERLLSHALACVKLIEQEQIASQEAARLLNQTGNYLTQQGRYAEAEPIVQRTLTMCEQVLGADHPLTACSLSNLAGLYQKQGKYDQAEALAQQALARLEQVVEGNGAVPSESAFFLATSLNNLAALYQERGKYAQAERLLVRACAIWTHTLGPVHPRFAYSQNNLGSLYEDQGRYDDAEAMYRYALFVSEQVLDSNHPHIATCLNNLAGLYLKQKKYEQAEMLVQRALRICETELGPNHPLTAVSLSHLAGLYFWQKTYEQAEPLFQRVLTINEYVLGPNHPQVAVALGNLADLYTTQSNYVQAEPLLKRALSILETVPSKNYSEMIMLLSMYASLLRAMKRDEEVKGLEQRAKQLYEDRRQAVLPQPDQQEDRGLSEAAQWLHHDALDNLDHLWNLTEEVLKRQSTEQEREKAYRLKQLLWALLDDMKNNNLSLLGHTRIGQEIEELLQQAPFVDLEERPFLKNIPGIGYVPDDFPFSSEADMKADYFWTQFSLQGSTSYTRFLVLLRHFSYIALPAKGKAEVHKLRQAIEAWREDWLTGPLPPVVYNGPSESAKRVGRLLERELFRSKFQEIEALPPDKLYKCLHPDDAQCVDTFRRAMAERFKIVKEQVITDLKKLGKLP